jgi:HSP20 family protein
MSLTPFFNDYFFADPWKEMERMRRDMDKLFEQGASGQGKVTAWNPAIDVKTTDQSVVVHAELPGLKKEDINVELKEGMLTISGEKKMERKEENEKYHRTERSYGFFSRSIRAPQGLKEEDIKARFENGVLEITFPKTTKEEQAKKITVA